MEEGDGRGGEEAETQKGEKRATHVLLPLSLTPSLSTTFIGN